MVPLRLALTLCCAAAAAVAVALAAPAAAQSLTLSVTQDDTKVADAFRVLQEAYRRIGITVEPRYLPNARALLAAERGETDGDVMRIAEIAESYPTLVRVPEPVITLDLVAFTAGLSFRVDGWESLRPFSICVLRGLKVAELATEGMGRMMANGIDQALTMLQHGRCEVAVLIDQTWLDIDRLHAGPMRALNPPVAMLPLFHYVHRRHADLVPAIAAALRQLHADGTVAAITSLHDGEIAAARERNTLPER
jgi:polar amino acid transport system substrate-binding protein